jgi:hypothetical protein
MNKLIEDLVTEASEEIFGNNPYNGEPNFEGYALDSDKLAMLIIEECTSWINENVGAITPEALADLKKHFGVK